MDARSKLPFLRALQAGLSLYLEGQWADAIVAFDLAHQHDPADPRPLALRAKAVAKLGNQEVKQKIEKRDEEIMMIASRSSSQAADSGFPEYWRGLADYAEGKFLSAKSYFLQAEKAKFSHADLYYHLGLIERNQGNEALAINYFQKALALNDPDKNEVIRLQLGVLCLIGERCQYELGLEHLNTVLDKTHPEITMYALFYLGKLHQIKGNEEGNESEKNKFYKLAADCYDKLMTNNHISLYLRLLVMVQGNRLRCKYSSFSFDKAKMDDTINGMKIKTDKSVEELCILLLAQADTGKFSAAWDTLFQLLDVRNVEGSSLYDKIPYYLKEDIFSWMVAWPAEHLQVVPYSAKTDEWKKTIVDLLKVRDTENYSIRLMQINAGLRALAANSLLGSILFVKQGYLTNPSTSSGKLKELAEHLNTVAGEMNQAASASGEVLLFCKATRSSLEGCQQSFEAYPALYKAIYKVDPPVRHFLSGLFGGGAAAVSSSSSQQQVQGTIQQDPIKQGP